MINVYLVRHGETDYNRQGVYFGWSNVPLNANGRQQAMALKAELAAVSFDAVWSSPLKRAIETAEIITGGRKELVRLAGLKEISFGCWEGRLYQSVEHEYPAEWQAWANDWQNFVIPQGESFQQFYQRVVRDWLLLKKQAAAKGCGNVLCTAHGGVIKVLLLYEEQRPFNDFWQITVEHGKAIKIVIN